MEGLHEEPAKLKDVFFKGTKQEPFSALSKKSIKQEMAKSFAPRVNPSMRPKVSNFVFEESDKDEDLGFRKQLRRANLDTIDKRITISKIKERTTILKNVNHLDENSAVSEEEQYVFKKVTGMLENHLQAENNPFRLLIVNFQEYLVEKFRPVLERTELHELAEEEIEQQCNGLCQQINDFLSVVVKAMILFYNFDICNFRVVDKDTRSIGYVPCTILNFDNLMNFTTIMMFPTKIYSLVLDLMQAKNLAKEKKFALSLALNQKVITMDKLGIEEKFRLYDSTNIGTCEYIKITTKYSFSDKPHLDHEKHSENSDAEDAPVNPRKMSEVNAEQYERKTLLGTLKAGGQTGRQQMDLGDEAYKEAIKTLGYLSEVESPFEKMKVLLLVIRRIIKTINEHNSGKSNKVEVLTGDQIMALTVYVVLKARVPHMYSYIEFIETFLPPKMFGTFCGYYLTVFNAACEYILTYEPK